MFGDVGKLVKIPLNDKTKVMGCLRRLAPFAWAVHKNADDLHKACEKAAQRLQVFVVRWLVWNELRAV